MISGTQPNPAARWRIEKNGIAWDVPSNPFSHHDHVEMSGRKVSVIGTYGIDEAGQVVCVREVIWPMLRTKPKDERAYLRRTYGREFDPKITIDGEQLLPTELKQIGFDGMLSIKYLPFRGATIVRELFPSTKHTAAIERWSVTNSGSTSVTIEVAAARAAESDHGVYGEYSLEAVVLGAGRRLLQPSETLECGVVFSARKASDPPLNCDPSREATDRREFCDSVFGTLQLECPDDTLNTAFCLAKLRAAESVFDTAMGLVHSPGGGNYYGGVWTNDQAEYSGPFFPFLGEVTANDAALNAYRIFAAAMESDYRPMPSSVEVEGDSVISGFGDRGDAAMFAYGAARYALALGRPEVARELWPAVDWALEYCRRKTNMFGVVESDTDELEGRFPTGTANLSTSSLTYGALCSAADLADWIQKTQEAHDFRTRAEDLRKNIESYFGATVQGYQTYRYYAGNTTLRSWICLPLAMGISDRSEGTRDALCSPHLWTLDGLATEAGKLTFWDRGTLFAIRGLFVVGETQAAVRALQAYTQQRLLGDHVPYPVEAYPENDQAHLSAESALYCRAVVEGLFGILPRGFRRFDCTPRLPDEWTTMNLRYIKAFDSDFDILVDRLEQGIRLRVMQCQEVLLDRQLAVGECCEVTLPL